MTFSESPRAGHSGGAVTLTETCGEFENSLVSEGERTEACISLKHTGQMGIMLSEYGKVG